jgi:hypothetical protein
MLKKGTVVLLALTITLVSLEGVARYLLRSDWLINTTSDLSSMKWRYRWLNKYYETDTVSLPIDTYHPILGWYPVTNAKNIPYGKSFISFNQTGIRGQKIYSKKKPQGTTRIAVFGDSYTFGEDVNDEETYSAQLEKLLPQSEVLNFGVHGYGIDQMALRLQQDGFAYHPDYIILAFIYDDLNRTLIGFRDYMKPKYVLEDDKLKLTNTPVIPPNDLIRAYRYRPSIADLIPLLYERIVFRTNQEATFMPLVQAIWKQSILDIRKHHATPILLYLPTGEEMINTGEPDLPIEGQMFSTCESMGISCFSARRYFVRAYKNGYKLNTNEHYSPGAHKLVAEGLAEDLSKIMPLTSVDKLGTMWTSYPLTRLPLQYGSLTNLESIVIGN